MSNLDYIQQLGIGDDQEVGDTEAEPNKPEESQGDLNSDSEVSTSDKGKLDTDQVALMESLQKQIEGMEKRISDKDAYINELKESSRQKEERLSTESQVDTEEEDSTFWDDPDNTIKKLVDRLEETEKRMSLQDMLMKEQVYSHTVEDYWKTVTPEALQDAVATDAAFSRDFNGSSEPYKFAYEYLSNRAKTVAQTDAELRDKIKAELMAEMGVKERKEAPPSMSAGRSGGNTNGSEIPDDGFAAVFGQGY